MRSRLYVDGIVTVQNSEMSSILGYSLHKVTNDKLEQAWGFEVWAFKNTIGEVEVGGLNCQDIF